MKKFKSKIYGLKARRFADKIKIFRLVEVYPERSRRVDNLSFVLSIGESKERTEENYGAKISNVKTL